MGIKDMPHIYKLTLCLWKKFLQAPTDVVFQYVSVVEYKEGSNKEGGFLLWFFTTVGSFFVTGKETTTTKDYK